MGVKNFGSTQTQTQNKDDFTSSTGPTPPCSIASYLKPHYVPHHSLHLGHLQVITLLDNKNWILQIWILDFWIAWGPRRRLEYIFINFWSPRLSCICWTTTTIMIAWREIGEDEDILGASSRKYFYFFYHVTFFLAKGWTRTNKWPIVSYSQNSSRKVVVRPQNIMRSTKVIRPRSEDEQDSLGCRRTHEIASLSLVSLVSLVVWCNPEDPGLGGKKLVSAHRRYKSPCEENGMILKFKHKLERMTFVMEQCTIWRGKKGLGRWNG